MKIEDILSREEGKTLEFKRDLSSVGPLLKTVIAFANTSGGTILVGVEDQTKVVKGISDPLDEEEKLANLIADNIYPRLAPNIEIVNWKNKQLLRVEVYPSPVLPHYLKKKGEESGVYIRLGSTNRQADKGSHRRA